ncbi:MAG TPA: hypothetical protein VJ875_00740 [Pyrinomonadaceae bacterium]|nr:hypothetical protein [Pyrinomonadaceae bacterium]
MNPGTANNDDYAGGVTLPSSWGPFAGQTLALIDSKLVRPRTFGMSDDAFMGWVQKQQTFDVVGKPGVTQQIIPAEWNYYGGMEMTLNTTQVIGVQTGPGEIYSEANSNVPLTNLLGADLGFSGGHITDVNSEGSPPATQFFIDGVTLVKDQTTFLSGSASKGACQWLNFYRNVNLTADGGAGGYVYHVIRKSQGTIIDIPGFENPNVVGAILRYYLFRFIAGVNTNEQIEALYQRQQTNPATLEIVGTFAPLYEEEHILTTPTGRLMVCNQAQIPTPAGSQNNGPNGLIALAPAVLQVDQNIVSADFVGTFPDNYQTKPQPSNSKYDFGDVSLVVYSGLNSAVIGKVEYAKTAVGDQRGWILGFDISSNAAAQQVLRDPGAKFKLVHATLGVILDETDYYFASNQQGIYAEQLETGSLFLNQGTLEPATFSVFHRGQELSANVCPAVTVWQYRSIPLQDPGNAMAISTNHKPGQPIVVDTSQPGNFLLTFSINDEANPAPANYPPKGYSTFMFPPFITNAPSISLRILPNDEDLSQYYVDPNAEESVGNDLLTFEVLYEKVLRTYYLLYPVMIPYVRLNSEQDVRRNANAILQTTERSIWMSIGYMPRTRDMSSSRLRLLRAWCRKVL